ncbi:hypothetical protein ES319_A08G111700v1 [Gossypium barbadense]|nr:hypothetical protein ES319_A08G111700v1 [Gossypium barbadense]
MAVKNFSIFFFALLFFASHFLQGTRVVFWDLVDAFLFHLYRNNVESTNLENFLPKFQHNVLERSTSICWNKKRQSSFKSMKKKIQGATNEIRNVASLLGNEGLEVVNPKELDNLLKEE